MYNIYRITIYMGTMYIYVYVLIGECVDDSPLLEEQGGKVGVGTAESSIKTRTSGGVHLGNGTDGGVFDRSPGNLITTGHNPINRCTGN